MTLEVDVFWSFRSPYSYLATPKMIALERQWELKFNIRPAYPIAIRLDGWFKNSWERVRHARSFGADTNSRYKERNERRVEVEAGGRPALPGSVVRLSVLVFFVHLVVQFFFSATLRKRA